MMQTVSTWMNNRRRLVLGALGAGVPWGLAGCGGGSGSGAELAPLQPVGSWAAAMGDLREDVGFLNIPPPASTQFKDQTLRQAVRLSVGGEQIRIQFSNRYGKAPLPLARVRVARSTGAGAVDGASDVAVTFGGAQAVDIVPGAEVWSDRIAMQVPDGGLLAVSVYVQGAADSATAHRYANALHYVAPGDQSRAAALPLGEASQLPALYWMSAIDVYRAQPTPVVVAFGDSLTDGNGSTAGANLRYPDQLSARFLAQGRAVAVVNAGMGGNRWLHDRFGPRGVERFRRDVLGVAGVTHAIVQMGINDIGFQQAWTPEEKATAPELIAALAGTVALAKAAGVQTYLATLTPFGGHAYFSAEGEVMRQTVNAWIRANTEAAGVLDFDAAVRDPAVPVRILAAYRGDDFLHINDQGYARMAATVPLERFR